MSLRSIALVRYAEASLIKECGVSPSTFLEIYKGGAPWELGRPQPLVVELEGLGGFRGRILDVGCGKGENSMYLASKGYRVCAIDFVAEVIREAQQEAARRALEIEFVCVDALRVATLDRTFDTVLDSGTFHTFSDRERDDYAAALREVMSPAGVLYLLCFADLETRPGGPRRVTHDEIRRTFSSGFSVQSIHEARYSAHIFPDGARAWAAEIHTA